MRHSEKHCRLCNALQNPLELGFLRTCDTVIHQTDSFVLLPAIGPLVLGHVMVVSKKHYLSLAAMPKKSIVEYETYINKLSKSTHILKGFLEIEHGSTVECSAGGCVSHMHIHLLPNMAEHYDFLDDKLDRITNLNSFKSIEFFPQPYIMVRRNLNSVKFFSAQNLPTQTIRRLLCQRTSQENWDWRMDPRNPLIEETFIFWKKALSGTSFT